MPDKARTGDHIYNGPGAKPHGKAHHKPHPDHSHSH